MNYIFFQRPVLVFSLACLTLLTCLEVPYFVSFFCLIMWAWKWLSDMKVVTPLSRRMTTVLSFLLLGFIFIEYRTFWTQESSSSLLVGLTALKVMDYENRRDHLSVVLLGFLLLTLKPLYGFDLYWLPIQIACMLSLWWALSQDPRKLPRRVLGMVFAVSLPIALILFLVFPRVVLPWALSQSKSQAARMGFSTDLNPGEVAELAASSNLVFRVQFEENVGINPRELYWKGGVLTVSDGLSWRATKNLPFKNPAETHPDLPVVEYELIIEPGYGNVVFTLDPTYALRSKEGAVTEYEHFLWRASYGVLKSQRFFGKYQSGVKDKQWPEASDLQISRLPPKTQAWVDETKSKHKDFASRLQALRELYAHPEFTYTLTPGLYGKQGLDEFLFQKRRGFCEHFAGSFATLARALGIPARVVGGYQGAEYNALGEFWRVTQRQAHAWTEIWTGKEWQRVDPTTWITRSEFSRNPTQSFFRWIDQATGAYEALNFRWTNFLIDFDQNAQKLALREWMPQIFLTLILGLALFFFLKLIGSYLFSSKEKILKIRQNELSLLVQQIKESEEDFWNRDLSHLPPLEILKTAEKRSSTMSAFYTQVSKLYDRSFYQEAIPETDLKAELQNLQKKWMEIQFLQK